MPGCPYDGTAKRADDQKNIDRRTFACDRIPNYRLSQDCYTQSSELVKIKYGFTDGLALPW